MHFENNIVYHIYNQGNNHRQIFYEREHYLFFLRKMRKFLLPYGDLLCYCLMPNHFHWLFFVRHTELSYSETDTGHPVPEKLRSLNVSIGILLRSYSRAINRQYGWSGSIFRKETKAKDGIIEEFITVDSKHWNKPDYLAYCFYYIHNNPVEGKLTAKPEGWEFSSARDYAGLRNGTLCNQKLIKKALGEDV